MQDVQASWLLLLFCAGARANFLMRTVEPELTQKFASHHDEQLVRCLRRVLQLESLPANVKITASMPLTLETLGIGSALRTRDCRTLGQLGRLFGDDPKLTPRCGPQCRPRVGHPRIAVFPGRGRSRSVAKGRVNTTNLGSIGIWIAPRRWDFRRDSESGTRQNLLHGWQKETSSKVHKNHSEKGGLATVDRRRASIGQVSKWTLASVPFTSFPVCRVTRVGTQPFRVLLFRRLRLPLPLSVHSCSCGRRLDVLGDHRAACGTAGVLGRRGFRSGECHGADPLRSGRQGVHQRHGQEP